jgi:hypothetical protein
METMTADGTEKRVDELSKRVDFGFEQTSQRLARVEDDVRALRVEMKAGFDQIHGEFGTVHDGFGKVDGEFTAVRGEMKAGFDQVHDEFTRFRGEVSGEFTAVRAEMRAGFEKVDGEFTAVRDEMRAGFDGLQRQMTRFFAGTLGTVIAGVIVNVILSHS